VRALIDELGPELTHYSKLQLNHNTKKMIPAGRIKSKYF
jgi:hypothetical protein